MPRKTITMDLDFIQKDITPRFTVKQGDDLILNINVLMNGEPYEIEGQIGRFYVAVNKKVFAQTNNISIVENTATITLERSLLQKHGKALGELEITGDEGRILSLSFVFNIEKSLADEALTPEEYENYIEQCEARIEEFKQTLQDDYNSLKRVIIDENVGVNLQLQIDEHSSQLEQNTTKLKNIEVDVRDFGAIGDGVTDDTKAIQDAIDYVYENYDKSVFNAGWNQRGGIVNLKSGTFRCNDTIYLKEGITLKGSTVDSCKIISNADLTYGITNKYVDAINGYSNVAIKNISIVNNCIYLLKGYNSKIEDVSVYNSSSFGILLQLTVFTILRNIRIFQTDIGIEINGNAGAGNSTTCFCDNVWIAHCNTGLILNGSENSLNTLFFDKIIIEYCKKTGIIASGTKENGGIIIQNGHFEQNEQYLSIRNSGITMKNIDCDNLDVLNIVIESPTKDFESVCNFEDIIGNIVIQPTEKLTVYYKNVYSINTNTKAIYKSLDYVKNTYETTESAGVLNAAYEYFENRKMSTNDIASFDILITTDNNAVFNGRIILCYGNYYKLFKYYSDFDIEVNPQGTVSVSNSSDYNNIKYKIKKII